MNIELNKEQAPIFHPSFFESPDSHTPKEQRTLMTIRQLRGQRLTNKNVENMESPGIHKFTVDDKKLSGSNTRHLFKNLYGETLLTFLFFSEKNINSIQNLIKYLVFKETNYVVDKQSINELLIIMRSIFLEYSAHPPLIDEKMSEETKQKLFKKYTDEVARLNDIVVTSIVPKVISQLQQYLDYLRDASSQPYEIETPKNESITGERQYRSVTQVLLGGNL